MPATVNKLPVALRWMLSRDTPEIMGIEDAQFQWPWTEQDLLSCLRRKNCIGLVAEINEPETKRHGAIAGFLVYELAKGELGIVNMAVHAACERQGVGTELIGRLFTLLSPQKGRRKKIVAEVRETNVEAQLFFKALGFKAVAVIDSPYIENDEDGIAFEYRLGEA